MVGGRKDPSRKMEPQTSVTSLELGGGTGAEAVFLYRGKIVCMKVMQSVLVIVV